MPEPTYEEIEALDQKIEPWVEFFTATEGCEPGDMVRALYDAVGLCSSAQENEMAMTLLTFLRDYFLTNVKEGWWAEMIKMADYDFDVNAEMREMYEPKRPSKILAQLPNLIAETLPNSEST